MPVYELLKIFLEKYYFNFRSKNSLKMFLKNPQFSKLIQGQKLDFLRKFFKGQAWIFRKYFFIIVF